MTKIYTEHQIESDLATPITSGLSMMLQEFHALSHFYQLTRSWRQCLFLLVLCLLH